MELVLIELFEHDSFDISVRWQVDALVLHIPIPKNPSNMDSSNNCNVGIVNGKEWLNECDKLPGNLRYRVSVV